MSTDGFSEVLPPLPSDNSAGWRRRPYRIFFPLGFLLSWAGVLHWLLHGVGVLANYRPVFHSIAQIQGFMMSFAVGFLLTAIPRRTGTAPPAVWQMMACFIALVGSTIAAWFERWALSQMFWFVLVAVLLGFAARRFLQADAGRRPPNSFVWVPLALATGIAGSVLIASYGVLGSEYYRLHELGKLLLLQGMFLGLVVGLGGLVLPVMTRGQGPPDGRAGAGDRLVRVGHVAGALMLTATFWLENSISVQGGLALRAVLMLVLLLVSGQIWRTPTVPGSHRWLIWLSTWMIPIGYAMAAAFPAQKKAGLHVVFIGGFALMALTVGLHVTLAHGGYEKLARGHPWQVPGIAGLLALAIVFRGLVDFDQNHFFHWIATSAACFLSATVLWASLVLPRIWRSDTG
jgi:uncharacterized protein involved in response to NO